MHVGPCIALDTFDLEEHRQYWENPIFGYIFFWMPLLRGSGQFFTDILLFYTVKITIDMKWKHYMCVIVKHHTSHKSMRSLYEQLRKSSPMGSALLRDM